MIAGRGITHSERASAERRKADRNPLFGIQTWVALPDGQEDVDPAFEHQPKAALPPDDQDEQDEHIPSPDK